MRWQTTPRRLPQNTEAKAKVGLARQVTRMGARRVVRGKTAVEGRQIFFQNVYDKTGKLRLGKVEPKSRDFREWSGIVHPLVRTHGETGRKALYLGGTVDGAWIVGMSRDESDSLLAALWDHTINTEHVFVQQWDEGDIMMWDNRCTMHRRDSFDPAFVRIMHRTTTSGERPV